MWHQGTAYTNTVVVQRKAFVHLYGLYGAQNNDPKYFGALVLGASEYITLGWKTDFADVVKVKDLEMGSLSSIIQVGPV